MTPKLILTRPDPEGRAFAQRVQAALGRLVDVIFSPAFKIVPLKVAVPDFSDLAFTSTNGVAQAVRMNLPRIGTAYCVGDRTAKAAHAAGFASVSAGGDAEALIALIQDAAPTGPILHLAGRFTRGDVANRLRALGLDCTHLAAYDQIPLPPSDELVAAMAGNAPLVSPVFSARSAAPLAAIDRMAPLHGVAIGPSVAEVLTDLAADTVTTAQRPDETAMVHATCNVLLRLFDRG